MAPPSALVTELTPPPPESEGARSTSPAKICNPSPQERSPPPPLAEGARSTSPTKICNPSPQERTPPPPLAEGARTPPPICDASPQERTPSPPSKRRRGRSSPPSPPNTALPASPRRRSCSTPPPLTRGEMMTSEDKSVGSASDSSTNRRMTRKLTYSPDHDKENGGVSGPVEIFWDIENCAVPKDISPGDIAGNVMTALGTRRFFSGHLTKFCAYGDFDRLPTRIKNGLQSSGIQVEHVPHLMKENAVDMVMILRMLLFAVDNRAPASIILISGDSDFSLSLSNLRQRGYHITVAFPLSRNVSSYLTDPADVVFDWPSLARGNAIEIPKLLYSPPGIEDLKVEMRKLFQPNEEAGLPFSQIAGQYQKRFSKPLITAQYGCDTLSDLFEKLGLDMFLLLGGGENRMVYLNTDTNSVLHETHTALSDECGFKGDLEEQNIDVDEGQENKVIEVEDIDIGHSSQVPPPLKKKKKRRRRPHRC